MAHIDEVLGPADDTVTFFQPRAMVYVTMLWVVAANWIVCLALFTLVRLALGDAPAAGELVTYAELGLIVPVVVAAVVLLVVWRRLGWLHSSLHGLDFAATGRRARASALVRRGARGPAPSRSVHRAGRDAGGAGLRRGR